MRLPQMGMACAFSLAMAPFVGMFLSFGDSEWTMFIGLAIILLAAGIFVGAQTARERRKYSRLVQQAPSEKISKNLVALSSAAVLAVYAAGYFRTNSAAHRFEEQSAQLRTTAPIAAGVALPPASPNVNTNQPAPPAVSRSASGLRAGGNIAAPSSSAPAGMSIEAPASTASPESALSATSAEPAPLPTPTPPPVASPPQSAPNSDAVGGLGGQRASELPPVPLSAPPPTPAPQLQYKDGTYLGWGTSRHGDIQAAVVIEGGKIVSAEIVQCLTRYSCSVIAQLPGQVLSRQSVNIDFVSGATQSVFAYHDAVAQALSKAK